MPYPMSSVGASLAPNFQAGLPVLPLAFVGPWPFGDDPKPENRPDYRRRTMPAKPADDRARTRKKHGPKPTLPSYQAQRVLRRLLPGAMKLLDLESLYELYQMLFPGEGPYQAYDLENAPPGWTARRINCNDCGTGNPNVELYWGQGGTPSGGLSCGSCVIPGSGSYHSTMGAAASGNNYVGYVVEAALAQQFTPYSWTRDTGGSDPAEPVTTWPWMWRNPQGSPKMIPRPDIGARAFYPEPQPFLVPGTETVPGTNPATRTRPRPDEDLEPGLQTGRPGRGRRRGREVPAVVSVVGGRRPGLPRRPAKEGKHPRERRDKEAKPRTHLPRWVWGFVSGITEVGDFVDAMFDALPANYRRYSGKSGIEKARTVLENFHKVDVQEALRNVIANEIEDRMYGAFGKAAGQEAKKLGRQRGWNVRPVDRWGDYGDDPISAVAEAAANWAVYGDPNYGRRSEVREAPFF